MTEKFKKDRLRVFLSGSNNVYLSDLLSEPGLNPDRECLYNILEYEHGQHLAEVIYKEWEISRLRDIIENQEDEHGNSLALIFENESQKLMLEELNKKLRKARKNLEQDIAMAADVQRSLLFKAPPETVNYDIAIHFQPASSVSGDFYDFYVNDRGELTGLSLVDVSGHGVASSLLTVFSKPIFFRIFRDNYDLPLSAILRKINEQLIEGITETENFLTAVLLRFDEDRVEYANAAHPDIVRICSATGECSFVKPENGNILGNVLGVSEIRSSFDSYKFGLEKGDSIVLYTDGMVEGLNSSGKPFGEDGLISALSGAPVKSDAREILRALLSGFHHYTGDVSPDDDISVIVVKRKK